METLPVWVRGGVLDNDLLVVVGELVDDVLDLLVKLQVVVGSDALWGNGNAVWKGKEGLVRGWLRLEVEKGAFCWHSG